MKFLLTAAAGVLFASAAGAAPVLNQANSIVQPNQVENVRLVCTESGRCYRTGGRRYVQRRYYREEYAPRRAYVEPSYGYSGYDRGYYGGGYGGGPSIGFSFGTGRY